MKAGPVCAGKHRFTKATLIWRSLNGQAPPVIANLFKKNVTIEGSRQLRSSLQLALKVPFFETFKCF